MKNTEKKLEFTVNIKDTVSPLINEMAENNKKIIKLLGCNANIVGRLLNDIHKIVRED